VIAGALIACTGTALAAEGDLDSSFSGDGRLVFTPRNGIARAVAVDSHMAVARFLPNGSRTRASPGTGSRP
jgi:hypothetical protein